VLIELEIIGVMISVVGVIILFLCKWLSRRH